MWPWMKVRIIQIRIQMCRVIVFPIIPIWRKLFSKRLNASKSKRGCLPWILSRQDKMSMRFFDKTILNSMPSFIKTDNELWELSDAEAVALLQQRCLQSRRTSLRLISNCSIQLSLSSHQAFLQLCYLESRRTSLKLTSKCTIQLHSQSLWKRPERERKREYHTHTHTHIYTHTHRSIIFSLGWLFRPLPQLPRTTGSVQALIHKILWLFCVFSQDRSNTIPWPHLTLGLIKSAVCEAAHYFLLHAQILYEVGLGTLSTFWKRTKMLCFRIS